jgi:hypothetical protein
MTDQQGAEKRVMEAMLKEYTEALDRQRERFLEMGASL